MIAKAGAPGIMPVVVYPKKYLDERKEEIASTKAKISSRGQPVFFFNEGHDISDVLSRGGEVNMEFFFFVYIVRKSDI